MLAQERIRGVGGVDAGPQVGLRVAPRLAELDPVAALGDDPVEDRRRPLPALDLADDRRVRQAEDGHQRVGLGGVAGGLVGLERADQRVQVVERGHALAADAGVGGAARDGEPERDRAGVGDHDVEARRLGDDRHVAGDAGADRREHALAAVLLRRHGDCDDLALERVRGAGSR